MASPTERCALHSDAVLKYRFNRDNRKRELFCPPCGRPPAQVLSPQTVKSQANTGGQVPAAIKAATAPKGRNTMANTKAVAVSQDDMKQIARGMRVPTKEEREFIEALVATIPGYKKEAITGAKALRMGWAFSRLTKQGLGVDHVNIIHDSFYINRDGYTMLLRLAERGKEGRFVERVPTEDEKSLALAGTKAAKEDDVYLYVAYQRSYMSRRSKRHPDGAVEEWDEKAWDTVASAVGRGSPTASKQPVEAENPLAMARSRAMRQICRELTGGYGDISGLLADVAALDEPAPAESGVVDMSPALGEGGGQPPVETVEGVVEEPEPPEEPEPAPQQQPVDARGQAPPQQPAPAPQPTKPATVQQPTMERKPVESNSRNSSQSALGEATTDADGNIVQDANF